MTQTRCTVQIFNATNLSEVEACSRLRHQYFVQEKKWVSENVTSPGLESDIFDPHCLHLAVFQQNQILAYLRVLPYQAGMGFMLEQDFACLLKPHRLDVFSSRGAVELSRLVCHTDSMRLWKGTDPHPVELLLKLLYQESKVRGFTQFYIVVEEAWLRPFARRFGLPFRVLGTPYTFPDGTRTVAAVATLQELEAGMKQHSAAKYEWYQRVEEEVIRSDAG